MSIGNWLDERTGYRHLVSEALDEPVPGGARWAYVWGSALTVTFITQAVTGFLLMAVYQPGASTAWASVAYIQQNVSWGWIVRGLHHYGAQAMVILLVMHLGQTAIYGAYKKPREMNWLLGIGLMGLTLAFALTGYLLPWDQKGYWATKVATNIAGTVPVIGAWTQRLLVGGSEYGHMTLTRFYSLHVAILPLAMALILVAHIALFRKHGVTPPRKADVSKVDRFHPKQLLKDLAVGLAVLAVSFVLTFRTHGANVDAPADPASDYPARPEWYFLALFEALKHMPGHLEWLVAAALPVVVFGYLALLPFIDRKPGTALVARLVWLSPLVLGIVGAVALTAMSLSSDARDAEFQKAHALAETRATRALELARDGVPPGGPLVMLALDPKTRGPELFDKHCTACHKLGEHAPAEGKLTAPDLTGYGTEKWVLVLLDNPDAPHLFGKTPFEGKMLSVTRPPKDPEAASFFTKMTEADQKAVAEFLATESTGHSKKGMPGEKLVRERCTSCHRLDGKTDDPESLAPELRGWASLAWIEQQIKNPGSGKTYPPDAMGKDLEGHMPAFESELDAQEIALLSRWVYEQATGRQ